MVRCTHSRYSCAWRPRVPVQATTLKETVVVIASSPPPPPPLPLSPPPPMQMVPPPSTPRLETSGNTEASSNLGGIVGGVVGGCFVPILLCILWLCGVFTKFGCPSPLKKPAASQQVELQQNPKAAGATQPDTTTQQLKDLAELKEKGQLTDDEFAAAKARVLNKV